MSYLGDECWLDVTGSTGLFGSGETIAQEIRNRIKAELGITVWVGASYNKIFAKLNSVIWRIQLSTVSRQCKFEKFTNISSEIARKYFWLFQKFYSWNRPVRSIGISVSEFAHDTVPTQTDLFSVEKQRIRMEKLDGAVDVLKRRFGNYCIQCASFLKEPSLTRFNLKDENTIHPVGYLNGGDRKAYKKYIDVIIRCFPDGRIRPLAVYWVEGQLCMRLTACLMSGRVV